MNDNFSVQALYEKIMQTIKTASTDIDKNTIDLSNMGSEVETYCKAVAGLPEAQGMEHKANLHQLMQAITTLGDMLVTERDAVYKEIQSLENVRRAHNAYHKTRAIKGEFNPNENES